MPMTDCIRPIHTLCLEHVDNRIYSDSATSFSDSPLEPPVDVHGFAWEIAALRRKSGTGNALISVSLSDGYGISQVSVLHVHKIRKNL